MPVQVPSICPAAGTGELSAQCNWADNAVRDNDPQAKFPWDIVRHMSFGVSGSGCKPQPHRCGTLSGSLSVSEPCSLLCKRQGENNGHQAGRGNEVQRRSVPAGLLGGPEVSLSTTVAITVSLYSRTKDTCSLPLVPTTPECEAAKEGGSPSLPGTA